MNAKIFNVRKSAPMAMRAREICCISGKRYRMLVEIVRGINMLLGQRKLLHEWLSVNYNWHRYGVPPSAFRTSDLIPSAPTIKSAMTSVPSLNIGSPLAPLFKSNKVFASM
jgi:hypothetical protein